MKLTSYLSVERNITKTRGYVSLNSLHLHNMNSHLSKLASTCDEDEVIFFPKYSFFITLCLTNSAAIGWCIIGEGYCNFK